MKSKIIISVLSICLFFSFIYIFLSYKTVVSSCPDKYPLISSDLNCDADPQDETIALESKVRDLTRVLESQKKADKVSVFYRDLNNRQWFGIHENDLFEPGSLLKLPLAIAYYKLSEVDPNLLDLKYKYTNPSNDEMYDKQYTEPENKLKINTVYTVKDLINSMIKYSDNAPVSILVGGISESFFQKVFIDLGIRINGVNDDFVSVKVYGSIFRSLFNASYLNQFYSNQLLEIMSNSSFQRGIVSGVPKGIVVANKFGERIKTDPSNGKIVKIELHDCGIVYDNKNPYIICVMTQGDNYDSLVEVISKISRSIYENR